MRRRSPSLTIGLVLAAAFAGCGDDMAARPPDTTPDPDPNKPTTGALCAAGQICTLAGTGIAGDGQDGLPARQTRLYLPQDTTVGPDGRLFVVDWNNHRIRVIDADGTMRIVAGIGELGLAADDPTTDRLNHPTNVAFDATGSPDELWIAAWHNSRVKKVDLATGTIIDVCGKGKRGFAGNDGPAAAATLDLPVALVFDAGGNMLIADQANQMIRRVDRTTGMISTIAGTGHCADAINPNPCVLNDGGPATAAGFHFPIGQMASPGGRIALAADGAIYVADTDNFRLRRIDTAGVITTFAGTGTWGFAGDGEPAAAAQLGRVADVAVGPDGRVYIADSDNNCVRVVSPDGIIATLRRALWDAGIRGRRRPRHRGAARSPVRRRGRTPGRDLHRRHPQPAHPRRLSPIPVTPTEPETELPMRDPNAGKSTFATMVTLSALASLTLVATHGDASACGGLFCNARPPDPFAPLPVAQNGENVVFSITKDPAGGAPTLQAHIQILYTGDAAKFSWVVPVDADPGMPAVGTDRLFAQLHADQPRFSDEPADGRHLYSAVVRRVGRLVHGRIRGHHGRRGRDRGRRWRRRRRRQRSPSRARSDRSRPPR